MAEKILMLALSPTMESGTIAGWMKKEGDTVENGDVLCEVETDKATMEYEAIQEGTLLKIVAPPGASVKVEDPIAVIGDEGEDIGALVSEIEKEMAEAAAGAASAGADAAPTGAAGGAGSAQAAPAGDAGAAAAGIGPAAGSATAGPVAVAPPAPVSPISEESPVGEDDGRIKASPLARSLASQAGIDIAAIRGSGPGGRIVKRDIEAAISGAAGQARPVATTSGAAVAAGAGASAGAAADRGAADTGPRAAAGAAIGGAAIGTEVTLADQIIPVSQKRKIIAERLAQSKYTAPHFYLKMSVFPETMMTARQALNASLNYKISVNAFLLKFSAEAIKRHPVINSSWQTDTIRTFGQIDIGLAVAQSDGLITPIVRDCGSKGIIAIDRELGDLIDRARNNKLDPQEYTGATFTITSLGTYGVEEFTGIINPPGSAILAVGQMQKTPVVDDSGSIVARLQMKLTLSCDHRVIDGAQGANFLKSLKDIIESPVRALY